MKPNDDANKDSAPASVGVGAAALRFVDASFELQERQARIEVARFAEDVEEARRLRAVLILPAIARGDDIVLDFGGLRFVTQSFAHALLYDLFKTPGSLRKLVFRGCATGTEEMIRLVAEYSTTDRQQTR